jgi:hypothetical protein
MRIDVAVRKSVDASGSESRGVYKSERDHV